MIIGYNLWKSMSIKYCLSHFLQVQSLVLIQLEDPQEITKDQFDCMWWEIVEKIMDNSDKKDGLLSNLLNGWKRIMRKKEMQLWMKMEELYAI